MIAALPALLFIALVHLVVGLTIAAVGVVMIRNVICVAQLAIAGWVFATRLRPESSAYGLWRRQEAFAPPVSVLAPAFNEELTIAESVRSQLSLQYPDFELVVINDGSKDDTIGVLKREFDLHVVHRSAPVALHQTRVKAVYASHSYPQLLVIDKENGRKADAINCGISYSRHALICVIDADSIIDPDGLLRATEPFMFDDGQLIAVGGSIRIANGCDISGGFVNRIGTPKGWVARFQCLEYFRAFLAGRVAFSALSILLLISGAFGIFRRDIVMAVGGYKHDTVGEDLEILVRMQRHMRELRQPCRVEFLPDVCCWTEAPANLKGIRNQRSRWQQGALETIVNHAKMLGNPRYGRIGMVAMPLMIIEDLIGPPIELVGYLVLPLGFWMDVISWQVAAAFLCLTAVFGTALSVGALALEERQLRPSPTAKDLAMLAMAAFLENFGYRQVNLLYRLRGIWQYLKGNTTWAAVERVGFARAPQNGAGAGPPGGLERRAAARPA
ncbi:MAG: glycosyltransferase family 2 protein [Proteobacteria bacterium]|nr:glycosyltransferase family 2 protein [Pseudomonadota bacterium]